MTIKQSDIFNDVKIFTSDVYKDHRGLFTESFNEIIQKELTSQMGYKLDWNDFCNSMYIK